MHVKMRALPYRNHRTEHDNPYEDEFCEFLCPKIDGDEAGVAGDDLHCDRDDQCSNQRADGYAQKLAEEFEGLLDHGNARTGAT